jgi:hypothetical protein
MWRINTQTRLVLAVLALAPGCGASSSSIDSPAATPSLAPTAEARAAMELSGAKVLEKSRKTKEAMSAYRRIVQEYPDSPQARLAAERLDGMGSK